MSDSLEELRRKLNAAGELKSVVRAMKAVAASGLSQFEKAVASLSEYHGAVQLALKVSLGGSQVRTLAETPSPRARKLRIVVFGSDQGLVGQFNETIAAKLESKIPPTSDAMIWAVGLRLADSLADRNFPHVTSIELPQSAATISTVIGVLLRSILEATPQIAEMDLHLFHHQPQPGATYRPIHEQIFPLTRRFLDDVRLLSWPTRQHPELIGSERTSIDAVFREHLFLSLFRACAESLASENASRLMAMQRAEKNIDDISETLTRQFHQLRQNSIDEELFDVVSGFEAFARKSTAG